MANDAEGLEYLRFPISDERLARLLRLGEDVWMRDTCEIRKRREALGLPDLMATAMVLPGSIKTPGESPRDMRQVIMVPVIRQ